MAKAKYKVLARLEARENNSGISSWVTIGFAIPGRKEGEINIKLQTLPAIKNDWDGWIYLRENEELEEGEERTSKKPKGRKYQSMQHHIPEDDIPF